MYILKGFMSMPMLVDDSPSTIADFGELSTYLKTFTRDIRSFADTSLPDAELFIFRALDEMEQRANPSNGFKKSVLSLGQWVYEQHRDKVIPTNANKAVFISSIRTQFTQYSNIEVGEILESTKTLGARCPDFIRFDLVDGTRSYRVTIWFSDSSMRNQYEHYEVFVIPPLPDVNMLIGSKVDVHQQLVLQNEALLISRIQEITGKNPHTALYNYALQWHDPNDFNSVLETRWNAVIYGDAGNDVAVIREEIKQYIADNSDYTEWGKIYPDLYSEAEFIFVPMWNKFSLDANALQYGIYSPYVKYADIHNAVKKHLPASYVQSGTTVDNYLRAELRVGVSEYRTISYGSLGNPNNSGGRLSITDLYPDVNLAVSSLHPDFGRMSTETQEFARKFSTCMDHSRKYHPNSPVPTGYEKVVRKGYHYLSFRFKGYDFAILTKYSFGA